MVLRNRATKKLHTCKRADYDKMPDKYKNLFDIEEPNDIEKEIPVVGTGPIIPNGKNTNKNKPTKKEK